MADRKYYVICDDNCKFEGMTKEQIITAIEQAISTGNITDVDAGFITKIKEQNKQLDLSFWVGTQEEYNAIETKKDNCFYIINNSENISELKATVDEIKKQIDLMNTGIDAFTDDVNTTMENQNSLINDFVKKHITIVEEYHGDRSHYFKFSNGLEIEFGEIYIFDGGETIYSDCDIILSEFDSSGTYTRKSVRFPFYKAQNIKSLNVSLFDYFTGSDNKHFQAINAYVWDGKEGRFLVELSGGDRNSVTIFNESSFVITYSAFGSSSSN